MKIKIYSDYSTLSHETANLIAGVISKKHNAIICLASGHTPIGVFQSLIQLVQLKKLDLSGCMFVGLDEWLGIGPDQPGSCRHMMDHDFFHPLHIPESNIRFFDSLSQDPIQECNRMNQFIASHHGLDVMLVGIGLNGHIAMNEPGTPVDIYAHVGELSEVTKKVGQKYFPQKTSLSKGLTLGLRHFTEAKLPILMANGQKKASIIQKALTTPPSLEIPASIVQTIQHAVVALDQEAAMLLPQNK